MSGRVGRPCADRLALVEEVAALLATEPGLGANAVYRRLGGRRSDVLRVVKALRVVAPAAPSTEQPEIRFPNPESGVPS